jgi:hypothetical protein
MPLPEQYTSKAGPPVNHETGRVREKPLTVRLGCDIFQAVVTAESSHGRKKQ